jgi:hypothetical protein
VVTRRRSGAAAAGLDRRVGSRSDGRGCTRAVGRRRAAGDAGGRRRAAAELADETQYRVLGLGLTRGEHLRKVREVAKLAGAVALAERQRSGRSTQRRRFGLWRGHFGRHGA